MSKSATIFVVDAGPHMHRLLDNGKSALENAKFAVCQMLHEKILTGRKGEQIGLVVCGSDVTDNQLANDGEYGHVSVLQRVETAAASHLPKVCAIECSSSSSADCLDSIVVAADILITHCKKLKFTKTIRLFTNGRHAIKPAGIEVIADTLKENNIQVLVIDLDQSSDQDNQTESIALLRNFCEDLLENSHVYSFTDLKDSLDSFHVKSVSMTSFHTSLRFGTELELQVSITSRTKSMPFPRLKKALSTSPNSKSTAINPSC
eukprot:Partr_v1_DN28957_c1_g1_i3_m25594 putative X-ray repair complementing defective repair in Chinese hamster cells 5